MRYIFCLNRIDGNRHSICMHPDHFQYKRKVRPSACQGCKDSMKLIKVPSRRSETSSEAPSETPQEPCRSDVEITPLGTLIYARDGWEPPPCAPDYKPRSSDPDSDEAWILDPIDVVCKHLELGSGEVGSCGYSRLTRRCLLIESFIGPRTCGTCPKRDSDAG